MTRLTFTIFIGNLILCAFGKSSRNRTIEPWLVRPTICLIGGRPRLPVENRKQSGSIKFCRDQKRFTRMGEFFAKCID